MAAAADESFAAFNFARTLAASASRSVAASFAAIEAIVRGDCCASADAGRGRRDELVGLTVVEDTLTDDCCESEALSRLTSSSTGTEFSILLEE